MNFDKQPLELVLSRSPVIYMVSDAVANANNYTYQLEIHIWEGTIATPGGSNYKQYILRKTKDINGYAVFDISGLINGFFHDIPYSLPLETTEDIAVNVKVIANYITDKGIPGPLPITSNTIQSQWGYNFYNDEINHKVSKYKDEWLTDMPYNIYLTRDTHMSLFVRNTPKGGWDGWKAKADGGIIETHPKISPTPPDTSEQSCLNFKVGPGDQTAHFMNSVNNFYEITLLNGATEVGDKIRINIQDGCKYPINNVDYINRYGVWDRIVMYGNSNTSLTSDSSRAMRSVPFEPTGDKWKQTAGIFVKFNTNSITTLELNTGWVSEDYNEMIEQLLLSERVVVDGIAANLEHKELKLKTERTEKLINYKFNFSIAFPTINSIK